MKTAYWQQFHEDVQRTGWGFAIRVVTDWGARKLFGRGGGRLRQIRVSGFSQPVWYRTRTSDVKVIRQVLLRNDLEWCREFKNVRWVIDCGANIGLASLWFLETFPEARVSVVEPDGGNMAVCRKNLERFGERATFHEAGVWSGPCRLVVERGESGRAEEWAFRVRPARKGEAGDVDGMDLLSLMERDGIGEADVVKMDIELAEEEVLGNRPEGWLERTRNLVVELHSPRAEEVFRQVTGSFACRVERSGEYWVAADLKRLGTTAK